MKVYQIYINDLINELGECNYGICIGNINVTSPTFADDIASLAFHKYGLNKMLSIANDYRIKWQFDFSVPKCVVMLWGKDSEPGVKLKLGPQQLEIVQSSKHMGITLCSDKKLEQRILNKRISAAQCIVLASRGIGSYEAPVPPTIISQLYWSIGVPKMVYGLEVTPITDKHVNEIDGSHRKMAKLIQGLPVNTPIPAPLATIGWMSMKSYIALRKIMFLWQILYLPSTNIYRRIVCHILSRIGTRIYP